ncbi:MAG: hypothetical protein ACREFQ_07790, partial [Stellaceae bacterium]
YTHNNFGVLGDFERIYTVLGALSYTLGPTATAQLSFSRSAERSNIADDNINNDIITISLQKRF